MENLKKTKMAWGAQWQRLKEKEKEMKKPMADGRDVALAAPARKKELYLLDGSGYIFRAYYALPPLLRSDGLPVGAVYGFCQMILNIMEHNAPYLAVVFDSARENFRHDIYPDYKSNRGETPQDLVPQFPFFREAVQALGLPLVEQNGFEADDMIATLTAAAVKQDFTVKIYSSDKDLMQLVNGQVKMIDPFKNKVIGLDEVREKFGVAPEQVADVQALMGDPSDGFPGLPGIGPKTASGLIQEFGNLENLLANIDNIKSARTQQIVRDHVAEARIFYQLARLKTDAPLAMTLDDLAGSDDVPPAAQQSAVAFFDKLEFSRLAKKWRDRFHLPPPADGVTVKDVKAQHAGAKHAGDKGTKRTGDDQAAGSEGSEGLGEGIGRVSQKKFQRPQLPDKMVAEMAVKVMTNAAAAAVIYKKIIADGRVGLFMFQQGGKIQAMMVLADGTAALWPDVMPLVRHDAGGAQDGLADLFTNGGTG
ncbi:MAG: hypothetical protein ORN57_03560, partial [Alphaproteobacteria bacterium]|nr:hypothetical protein [Alphaproteobacteria bacterium]